MERGNKGLAGASLRDRAATASQPSPQAVSGIAGIPSAGTLLALAERCEKSEGPDRELDGAIASALGLPHGPDSGWCNSENGDYWTKDECADPFTASLDAVFTLVPEACLATIKELWDGPRKAGNATVTLYDEGFWQGVWQGIAATPALALCAAALRAHAAKARGES